jgi:TRAP-type C4-dicarboxylate transport system substrate-binding protein
MVRMDELRRGRTGSWPVGWTASWRRGRGALALTGALVSAMAGGAAAADAGPTVHLRIVGGLGTVPQYTRHEQPFWTQELPRLSGGRARADIVAFDEAGLSGSEMLRLIQTGAVPFGTALLPLVATQDPELAAPDLAGLSPDMAALRKHIAAFRPHLERRLRERWGIEALAVYVYPAQVTFCTRPFAGLADLAGRRIRTSSTTQSDLVEALGATPVQTAFNDIVPKLRRGDIECAITGTMSGNVIGLHEVTSHVHTMAANWGLAVFGANASAWQALPAGLRGTLQAELRRLEQAIWADADRETGEGLACNRGAPECVNGRRGRMVVVMQTPADMRRWHEIVVSTVLPRWVQRCGPPCAAVWNDTLGPVTGIQADAAPR